MLRVRAQVQPVYLPSLIFRARVRLRLFFSLCLFIFLLLFRFTLSMLIPPCIGTLGSSIGKGSFSTSNPSRRSVSSQSTEFPTRLITNARDSCRAASASASGDASGGSSIVPNVAGVGADDDAAWGGDSNNTDVG